MKLSWEVDGVEIVIAKLEDGIEAGMERAADQIIENLKRDAKDRIAVRPHIFTGKMYESFDSYADSADIKSGHEAKFFNSAKHAGAMEHGVHSSKYADGAPPIDALMPWVIENLSDWKIDTGDSGGSAIQTPTVDDGATDTDNTPESQGATANWDRFHKNGYERERLWIGQKVVFYDSRANNYKEGTVSDIGSYGDYEVTFPDGSTITQSYDSGQSPISGSGVVAGEDWYSLSESEKFDIASDMIDSEIDIDSSFSSADRERIDNTLDQYKNNIKDPRTLKDFANGLDEVIDGGDMDKLGLFDDNGTKNIVKLDTTGLESSTVRHEFAHAYMTSIGYDYAHGARHDDWDIVETFSDTSNLPYNYVDMGKQNWDTTQGSDLPHPTTYMLHDQEALDGVGLYDDPEDKGFEKWSDYVMDRSLYQLQQAEQSGDVPQYDTRLTEQQVFHPKQGDLEAGDAVKLLYDDGDRSKTFHAKALGSPSMNVAEGTWQVDLEMGGETKTIPISEKGFLDVSFLEYKGYAFEGADKLSDGQNFTDPDNIGNDPGFFASTDETMDMFREALNRELFTGMIAAEKGSSALRPSWYQRYDGYSEVNGQETVAHFFALIFDKDEGGTHHETKIKELLERSPELIYAGAQVTDYSPETKQILEEESEMDFDDLLYSIWREYIQ